MAGAHPAPECRRRGFSGSQDATVGRDDHRESAAVNVCVCSCPGGSSRTLRRGICRGRWLRSPAPAIVAGLAYVFAVEGLLTNSFASLSGVLFASQLDAIGRGGTVDVGYGSALIVAAAWAIGLIVVGGLDLRRRDIAA
jgi:hypothetical protein